MQGEALILLGWLRRKRVLGFAWKTGSKVTISGGPKRMWEGNIEIQWFEGGGCELNLFGREYET